MAETPVVGMLPKSTANPYFESCRRGALEAATELGVNLLWQGPSDPDPVRQVRIVEGWVRERVPVIAVSVDDQATLSPVLREARAQGVRVLTWDSDADPDARSFMVEQATAEGIAHALSFELGRLVGGTGTYAVITASSTSENQNVWLRELRQRVGRDHPGLHLAAVRSCSDDADRAKNVTLELLSQLQGVQAVVGLCAPAVPGAAEAMKSSGRRVFVTGLSIASICRPYLESGHIQTLVSWNTRNLGYLAVQAAQAVAAGRLSPGAASFSAGRLRTILVKSDKIHLGRPHIISLANVSDFDA